MGLLYILDCLVIDQALEGTGSAWWQAHVSVYQAKAKSGLSFSGSLVGSLTPNYRVIGVCVCVCIIIYFLISKYLFLLLN